MNVKQFKSLYDKLPREIFCNSLDTNVRITRTGYKHVFEEKSRKQSDIKTRAKAITHLAELIESINIYQSHSKRFDTKGDIEYWNIQGVIKDICIHITIRKIGGNIHHLYSWHYRGVSPEILKT